MQTAQHTVKSTLFCIRSYQSRLLLGDLRHDLSAVAHQSRVFRFETLCNFSQQSGPGKTLRHHFAIGVLGALSYL